MLAKQNTDGNLTTLNNDWIFQRYVNTVKSQILRLRNIDVSDLTKTNFELVFILSNISTGAEILLAIMEDEKPADLYNEINKKLDEITADLRRYEASDMRPSLNAKVASLKLQQLDFMKVLCSIPVNEVTSEKVTKLREKMLGIATLSRESGSIQGELTLAEQMMEMLTLLKRVTDTLSEKSNVQWMVPPCPEASSWRRLAASPSDPMYDELQHQTTRDSSSVSQENSGHHDDVRSIVSRQLADQHDTLSEDLRLGRRRNRLKGKGRRKDDPDTPPVSATVALPADVLCYPVDPDLAMALSCMSDDDSGLPQLPPTQFAEYPQMDNLNGFGSGMETDFHYAVASSSSKHSGPSCRSDVSKSSHGTSRHADVSDMSKGSLRENQTNSSERVSSQCDSVSSLITSENNSPAEHLFRTETACQDVKQPDPQGKVSTRDIDSGMVPDMSDSVSRFGNISGQIDPRQNSSGMVPEMSDSASMFGSVSGQYDPRQDLSGMIPEMSDSTSRFGSVSGQLHPRQDLSNISGYVSPPSADDPNLSNVFDGLEIRLSPSENSLHSFASFYSDYQPDLSNGRRAIRDSIVVGKVRRRHEDPDSWVSDQEESQPHPAEEWSDQRLDQPYQSLLLDNSGVSDTGSKTVEESVPDQTTVRDVRSSSRSDTEEESKSDSLADTSLRSLMFMVLFLAFAAGLCFYFKTTGLASLLEYYSWWEVLSKHMDVRKTGDSIF